MGLKDWLSDKLSKTASPVVSKTINDVKDNLNKNVVYGGEMWLTIGKAALIALILALTGKELDRIDKRSNSGNDNVVPNIVVNNYIYEKKGDETDD